MIGGLLAAYALGALQGEFQPAILTVSAGAAAGWVAWCLFSDRARGRLRCPRCGYDTSGNREADLTCPECGKTVRSKRGFQRTKRHWRRAVVGALPLLIGVGMWGHLMAKKHGWGRVLPDVVLAAIAPMDGKRLFHELEERLAEEKTGPVSEWIAQLRVRATLTPESKNWTDAAYLLPYGEMGRFQKQLIAGLSSTDPNVAEMAAGRLIETPLSNDARAALVQAATRGEKWVIEVAPEINLVEAAPALEQIVRSSESVYVRTMALGALVQLRPAPAGLAEAFLAAFNDPESRMRHGGAVMILQPECAVDTESPAALCGSFCQGLSEATPRASSISWARGNEGQTPASPCLGL